jgi:hypothetical protein
MSLNPFQDVTAHSFDHPQADVRELTTNGLDKWYRNNKCYRGWESDGNETLRRGSESTNPVGRLLHVFQNVDGIGVETLPGLRGYHTMQAAYEQRHAKIRFETANMMA